MTQDTRSCTGATRAARLFATLSGILSVSIFVGCGLSSRTPDSTPAADEPSVRKYVSEFNKAAEPNSVPDKGLLSQSKMWSVEVRRNNSTDEASGFYSVRLMDSNTSRELVIFTLWDANEGSGCSIGARWSDKGDVVRLKGRTRGFSYSDKKQQPYAFDFIYLVENGTIFSLD